MTLQRSLASGEYYHIFNRGAHKINIFREKVDWMRFLFFVLYSQSPIVLKNVERIVNRASLDDGFLTDLKEQERIVGARFIELVSFCIMPNHFHLLMRETEEDGIARYMQRIQVAYTMFFNAKHDSSGHVFQGRYKTVHVKDNRQLMYLSAYIHRNPRELKEWRGKEEMYPYSSLQDYTEKNRWGNLIATDIIASQFANTTQSNYRDFVRTSTAKILAEELEYTTLNRKRQ